MSPQAPMDQAKSVKTNEQGIVAVVRFDDEDSSASSSVSGTSITDANGDSSDPNNDLKQVEKLAKAENQRVSLLRVLVASAIVVVGAVISGLTYSTLSQQVEQEARATFVVFANTIEEHFRFQVENIFRANKGLAQSITSSAQIEVRHGTTDGFPYFAVPAFEAFAEQARKLAKFEIITYAPIANNLSKWIEFSQESRGWIDESKVIFDDLHPGYNRSLEANMTNQMLPPYVYEFMSGTTEVNETYVVRTTEYGMFVPSLQTSPPPRENSVYYQNVDLFSDKIYEEVSMAAVQLRDVVFSSFGERFVDMTDVVTGSEYHQNLHDMRDHAHEYMTPEEFLYHEEHGATSFLFEILPHSLAAKPIYKSLAINGSEVVGYVYSIIAWDNYLVDLLPEGASDIFAVLRNSCNESSTFELVGGEAYFISIGDTHDKKYDDQRKTVDLSDSYYDPTLASKVPGHCQIFLDIYPSSHFEQLHSSNIPLLFSVTVAFLFLVMAAMFFLYDRFVQFRNLKVLGVAARSNALVSSLFPDGVRDRLFAEREEERKKLVARSNTLKSFLSTSESGATNHDADHSEYDHIFKSRPIAELYPETTLMFGDIVGFTAWSSVREPGQVFRLLETIYHSFDVIAKKRRVFKVETVGDCYVAVVGLPEPRKDHAVTMVRFARDCMLKMWEVTKMLEVTLGPDTGDLTMRIGLHSGPVTAGVLRGERSRFQLFGDTMNTAARMESNGAPNKIHISQDTAELLAKAGKGQWTVEREDKINAKGKGVMRTFWVLGLDRSDTMSFNSKNFDFTEHTGVGSTSSLTKLVEAPEVERAVSTGGARPNAKTQRLVDWNVDVLSRLLKIIVSRRKLSKKNMIKIPNERLLQARVGETILDEVMEIITLPRFNGSPGREDCEGVELDTAVVEQLKEYVLNVCMMYRDNPFHNFEHASHVTMSVVKLLNRIVAPSEVDFEEGPNADASTLHDHTYGITSDPLTQFACVFSALIHDLDHPGVPNAQLVKESTRLANLYKNKSVAEQNSVDLAWQLLMEDTYKDLRYTIYADETEMRRFRQLVVNSVMATDIIDKDLKALRNCRWEKAFSTEHWDENRQDSINRKATIVIEHLIQASDVAHTMQHWHIYRKWNERFFMECYRAYRDGRAETDPSEGWYKGEMGFYDFYIIPLARKLKDCGVFGVSSDEYLNYAMKNRKEWEDKGQDIVQQMIENAKRELPGRKSSSLLPAMNDEYETDRVAI